MLYYHTNIEKCSKREKEERKIILIWFWLYFQALTWLQRCSMCYERSFAYKELGTIAFDHYPIGQVDHQIQINALCSKFIVHNKTNESKQMQYSKK